MYRHGSRRPRRQDILEGPAAVDDARFTTVGLRSLKTSIPSLLSTSRSPASIQTGFFFICLLVATGNSTFDGVTGAVVGLRQRRRVVQADQNRSGCVASPRREIGAVGVQGQNRHDGSR